MKQLLATLQKLAEKPLNKATTMPPVVYTSQDFYADVKAIALPTKG